MEDKFSRWVKQIRNTQAVEIGCSACLEQISQYVDMELTTGQAALRMPQVKQHLDQCEVCSEEYHVLRELARMEREDGLPSSDDLKDQLKNSG